MAPVNCWIDSPQLQGGKSGIQIESEFHCLFGQAAPVEWRHIEWDVYSPSLVSSIIILLLVYTT